MAVTATTLRLNTRLRIDLAKITNTQSRDLVAAWARAWDEVAGDLEIAIGQLTAEAEAGTISRAQVLRSGRLRLSLARISDQLTKLSDNAGVRIIGDLDAVVRNAGAAQAAIIGSQLPKSELAKLVGWDRVDNRQIDAIVKRSTEQITSKLWPISTEADSVIRRELVRGIASGSGPRETARRMIKRAEGGFNGGLSRALTIARTETLDAHRAAAAESHQANASVLAGWIWMTNLSSRTCPACIGMSGTEHKLSEPGPQGHANCRCSRVPQTKTWRELGIDIDEPPSTKPDAGEWFAGQDEKTQRGILGPARYDAWKKGDYPMDKWAVKKPNPDWRPSYQTSPIPSAGRSERLAS